MDRPIMHSAIYRGWVRHRRFVDRPHAFRYSHALLYLDIDEISALFSQHWFTAYETPGVMAWQRRHFLHPAHLTLREAVDHHLAEKAGANSKGPIRVLTSPSLMGLCFNPVTFYYCFDATDTRVDYILAEITNTPWDERFTYVIDNTLRSDNSRVIRSQFRKAFHVSPFQPMTHEYTWTFTRPGDQLRVHMSNHQDSEKHFDATLVLDRCPITADTLRRYAFARWPVPYHTLAGIYWQAFRLWWKGATFHDHPQSRSLT